MMDSHPEYIADAARRLAEIEAAGEELVRQKRAVGFPVRRDYPNRAGYRAAVANWRKGRGA